MAVHFRTVNSMGEEIAVGELKEGESRLDLINFCRGEFGMCLGALEDPEGRVDTWAFSRCIKDVQKGECNIRITRVWFD